jgi:hypothetical protein
MISLKVCEDQPRLGSAAVDACNEISHQDFARDLRV